MSKRKFTAEDKKTLLLQHFYDTLEIFHMKEIEKSVAKSTGIQPQAIKDILQKLLDDGLVDSCVIGSTTYYWAFPGKSKQQKLTKLSTVQGQLVELEKRIKKSTETLKDEPLVSTELENLECKIMELTGTDALLALELDNYDESDTPEQWEAMNSEIKKLHEAANRWTDNVLSTKSWCKKKLNCEDSVLDKQFGIPSDFDYLE